MLSAAKNERLTRVGPGTPTGELLRRCWWPIATHDMSRSATPPSVRMSRGSSASRCGVEVAVCPECGAVPAFVQEYWVAADRHVVCWCAACELMCTVVVGALVGTGPDH
jgi:hypothetical protein